MGNGKVRGKYVQKRTACVRFCESGSAGYWGIFATFVYLELSH